ncbi:hypothetical protein CCMA1212_006540 [Trichoderma ghanense]|uniref:Uncharacterized protein n=1 Tax=Trichoderma ghanense TaxID=65468 RepID=A0ABY2H1K7_9HYPO
MASSISSRFANTVTHFSPDGARRSAHKRIKDKRTNSNKTNKKNNKKRLVPGAATRPIDLEQWHLPESTRQTPPPSTTIQSLPTSAQLLHVAQCFFFLGKNKEGKMETVVRIRQSVLKGFSSPSSANARPATKNLGKSVSGC